MAGQNAGTCLELRNGTNVPSLFDDADSFFYANSEFREFDALPESADSNNEGHFVGQLAMVRARPLSCVHERSASGLIILTKDVSRGPVLSLRGDYSGEERRDLGGLPCSYLAASCALMLSSALLFVVTVALGLGGPGAKQIARRAHVVHTHSSTVSCISINIRSMKCVLIHA